MTNALDIFTKGGPYGSIFPRQNYSVNTREDGTIELEMALPGFSRDDLDIELVGDKITIQASSEGRGKVSRSFRIDDSIDAKKIKASLKDGILDISLPLKKERVMKIAVTA